MIKTEALTINGQEFIRTCSDSGLLIERDGALYEEAYDPANIGRVYTESNQTIEREEESGMEVSE